MKLKDCIPGTRVRIYESYVIKTGTIASIDEDRVEIKEWGGRFWPQQLRKLRPKAKAREFWIRLNRKACSCPVDFDCLERSAVGCIKVREIREKK